MFGKDGGHLPFNHTDYQCIAATRSDLLRTSWCVTSNTLPKREQLFFHSLPLPLLPLPLFLVFYKVFGEFAEAVFHQFIHLQHKFGVAQVVVVG